MSLSTHTKSLFRIFHPRSVAVVGASRDPKKIGHIVLRNILDGGFKGDVYPVNPEAESILDFPTYASYEALPTAPHVAIVAVPDSIVLPVVEAIAKKGTKGIVIFTAGFKETGEEGVERERALAALADVYDLTIIGPNCLGFYHATSALNATFARMAMPKGNIRFLSQSGAMVSSFSDFAEGAELGVAEIVTIGNKTVVGEADLLSYWASLPKKRLVKSNASRYEPIGLYLESIVQGRAFLQAAKEIGQYHPVLLLKPGKSDAAQTAMRSHTGAIAGEEVVLQAALNDAGIIRCDGVEDLFDLLRAFSWENAPTGPRVAVISNAGGPAVIASDAMESVGLQMAELPKRVMKELSRILPRMAAVHNPVDVLGDATSVRYREAFRLLGPDDTVDAMLVILTPQLMTDIGQIATVIGEASKKYGKPIIASFMGGTRVEEGEKILNAYQIPSFRYPERAVKALGAMWNFELWRQSPRQSVKRPGLREKKASHTLQTFTPTLLREKRTVLTNHESSFICRDLGVAVPETHVLQNFNDGLVLARRLAFGVILKIDSAETIHKTEVKGVVTDINDEASFTRGWQHLVRVVETLRRKGDTSARIIMQERIIHGIEAFVGGKQDPEFGPVVVVGVGGTLTEIIGGHKTMLAPVSAASVEERMSGTPLHRFLQGYRGDSPKAASALYQLVERVSLFLAMNPDIKEIDLNPVMVTDHTAYAADIKILMSLQRKEFRV
jgi:acetyltransferase